MNSYDGINSEGQQRINRALIINLLRKEIICSRAKLAELSNLRRTTITNIINDFISYGLVIETGRLIGQKKRRSIGIRINGNNFRVIGVMLTRKKYCLLSMGLSGETYEIIDYPILEGENVNKIIKRIKNSINAMISDSKDYETLAIGIALPGPYMRVRDEIVFDYNLAGCESVHIHKEFQESFSIPIFIENDANAGAYAFLWHKGEQLKNMDLVYILAEQGIGCGVIIDNNIMIGKKGLAGEIGHISIKFDGIQCECGNLGCLQTYCSTIALEKNLLECIKNGEKTILQENFSWDDVVYAVNQGDEIACREYKTICKYLAVGIVNIINLFNPELVVIGDQLAKVHPELMYDTVNDYIRKSTRPLILDEVKIEINKSEINPVILGAAAIAAQKVLENPFAYIRKEGALLGNAVND